MTKLHLETVEHAVFQKFISIYQMYCPDVIYIYIYIRYRIIYHILQANYFPKTPLYNRASCLITTEGTHLKSF